MKYFLIAGEASGDLHGSNLVKSIRHYDSHAEIECFGGDLMEAQGAVIRKHYREMAFMGIIEVLKNLRQIRRNFKDCKRAIEAFRPHAVVFIDYPGFNLVMAKYAKQKGLNTLYYISPKIWAWKTSRIKIIKKYIDKLFVILPFEINFFKKFDYEVEYVGNPLMDALDEKLSEPALHNNFLEKNNLPDKPIIALLAGSRKMEIEQCLPEMLTAAAHYKTHQLVIAGAPNISHEIYKQITAKYNVALIYNQTYELLRFSEAAIVVSGTATLETALIGTPQVVLYKTLPLTYHIGKHFFKLEFFSLVNLILTYEAVKEILQFNIAASIKDEMDKILFDKPHKQKMLDNYRKLQQIVGDKGASGRVGKRIVELVSDYEK